MSYTEITHPHQKIFLIDMRSEHSRPFSDLVQKGIAKYLQQGKKIAIIVNKKGYATGSVCKECGYIPRCSHCDVPIGYHLDIHGAFLGLCHICKRHYPNDATCSQCHGHNTQFYGLGSQQVAQWVEMTYHTKPVLVESDTVNSPTKIKNVRIALQETQVVIGSSLLAQPPENIHFDLCIVVHADSWLNIPDYQSSRQTFVFLYEAFSHHPQTTFLVQTYNPDHPALHYACAKDVDGMKTTELAMRKEFGYPPMSEMCVLLYKHEIEERLYASVDKLCQELLFLKETYQMTDLEITPTPPLIYKMFGKYRYHILLKGSQTRQFMDIVYSKLRLPSRGFKVDREPVGIL